MGVEKSLLIVFETCTDTESEMQSQGSPLLCREVTDRNNHPVLPFERLEEHRSGCDVRVNLDSVNVFAAGKVVKPEVIPVALHMETINIQHTRGVSSSAHQNLPHPPAIRGRCTPMPNTHNTHRFTPPIWQAHRTPPSAHKHPAHTSISSTVVHQHQAPNSIRPTPIPIVTHQHQARTIIELSHRQPARSIIARVRTGAILPPLLHRRSIRRGGVETVISAPLSPTLVPVSGQAVPRPRDFQLVVGQCGGTGVWSAFVTMLSAGIWLLLLLCTRIDKFVIF